MGNEASAENYPKNASSTNSESTGKLSRGIHYNIKIVIKGAKQTGKTSLWKRFQGLPFSSNYIPTESLQIATISWNYKTSDDIIKLELWDDTDESSLPQCDGLIFLYDATRETTLSPLHYFTNCTCPALVCANFADRTFENTVSAPTLPERWSQTPLSLQSGFGLRTVCQFVNMVFLTKKRKFIDHLLQVNIEEMESTKKEIGFLLEQTYDDYILSIKHRKEAKTTEEILQEETKDDSWESESESESEQKTSLEKEKISKKEVPIDNQESHEVPQIFPSNASQDDVKKAKPRRVQIKRKQNIELVKEETEPEQIKLDVIAPTVTQSKQQKAQVSATSTTNISTKMPQKRTIVRKPVQHHAISAEESLKELRTLAKSETNGTHESIDDFNPEEIDNDDDFAAFQTALSRADGITESTPNEQEQVAQHKKNPLLLAEEDFDEKDVDDENIFENGF